jgi:Ca2+-binding RTX toxin-like protein
VDHAKTTAAGLFGNDVMAGGADRDAMYGELGDDLMQGDGSIGTAADSGPNTRTLVTTDVGAPNTGGTLYFNVPEADTDSDDYMEGNGGNDLMYGGLGQDDMIGGSSDLFGLTTRDMRPDGSDTVYGGAGIDTARNNYGDATADANGVVTTFVGGHARDADFVMGDDADVYRLVAGGASGTNPTDPKDTYRTFVFDNYPGTLRLIPRAMQQLDYRLGGADYTPGTYVNGAAVVNGLTDNGAADLIHGESGDDVIFAQTGSDVVFGEGQDDDIVGGYGHDWISGGTGQDGVIGDDGLVLTSRNNATVGEPLYGVAALLATDPSTKDSNGNVLDELISTPGNIQIATINKSGELKKTADLVPFSYDHSWNALDDEFPDTAGAQPYADDIIFGGLGSDFLHGGSGDDAVSGAEALDHAYVPTYAPDGTPNGALDLGYAAVNVPAPVNPGDVLAFNPEDLDGRHLNNRFRPGEFALYDEYDPLRQIRLTPTGELDKSGGGLQFLLNFNQTEGVFQPGGVTPGNQNQSVPYPAVHDDGSDAIFGDLGNDWLVGGTGRDDMYGGWGNDLLNSDDDQTTLGDAPKHGDPQQPGANDRPDTHPTFEDRAYGGAGRDVLIGNTGGDRLIDWVGEYNSYLVPYAPFGMASVSRTLQPQLHEYLYALSKGDGADPTRPADTGADPLRNGEPNGENGLVLQKDFAWQDQTGAPSDPQAGNIPGGKRDVLRSADFNNIQGNPQAAGVYPDSGVWEVANGVLQVSAASPNTDAVSVFNVNSYLPNYYEMQATILAIKPTAGWKANAYLIFDYFSPTDFKFAGIDVSTNKIEMGHRTAAGWIVDAFRNVLLKPDQYYNLLLSVNGTTATLAVVGQATFTYTFTPRVIDGLTYGLNQGLVGFGSNNARGQWDNIAVQVLPPRVTFQTTENFDDGIANLFTGPKVGTWTVPVAAGSGKYVGTPAAGADRAVSLVDLGIGRGLRTSAYLDLSTKVKTATAAGFVFDYYGPDDFKCVTIDVAAQAVVLGHRTPRGGWAVDATVAKTLSTGTEYTLGLTVKGTTVSVTLNGALVLSYSFNAVAVDGGFGYMARNGAGTFDDFTLKTDDPAFQGPQNLKAATPAPRRAGRLATEKAVAPLVREAARRWLSAEGLPATALSGVRIVIADLPGQILSQTQGSTIYIDRDAAGWGWYIDRTPGTDSEFSRPGNQGEQKRMDLLTALMHEMGHVMGREHETSGVMTGDLRAGERENPVPVAEIATPDVAGPVAKPSKGAWFLSRSSRR